MKNVNMTMHIDEEPNEDTLEAMKQAENEENMNGPYKDIDSLMKDLNSKN